MKTEPNEPIAKTSGLPLKEHNQNLLKQAADALSQRKFVIEKYKILTNGVDFKAELETSAKWHDIGKTDEDWQIPVRKDFAIWKTLNEAEKRNFRATNLMKVKIRHEMASLQIALENNCLLSPTIKAAIAAHHGKLSRRHEERWKYRPIFQKFWGEFNNQSAEFPLYNKQAFDKIVLKRYQFDGIRSLLQLIDHRASAKENGDELPDFRTFDYKFPHKDEFGNDKKNEVQKKIEELWNEPFSILRAPTGAGKTDAALLWAKHQVDAGCADRLVIAMPTRFTANALSISVTEENFKNLGDAGLYHSSALYQRLKGKNFESKKVEWEVKRFVDKEQDLARTLETPLTVTTIDHLCICLTATRETHHATFFGLANSCVVIDEADFYDDFTQLNIVILLRALRLLKVPVLLMSATVPDSAMELYRQSGFQIDKIYADESDYERVRCTIKRYKDAEFPEEIEELLQRALNGEPTIIYANTVARAQAYYKWFKDKIQDSSGETKLQQDDVVIYHSRFIEPHKVEKENRLLGLLGRKAWETKTQRGIAILTQIGEISVNISANLMISDLCPLDRLAQRVGRLARFTKEGGELFVIKPLKTDKNGETRFYPAPYGEYSKKEGWQTSDVLEKSDELLTDDFYSAKTFVDKVNQLYPNLKESTSDALLNQKQLERLVIANWLILPAETVEEETSEDSDQTKDWRSRDIPFQYTIFTGFNLNFVDFEDDYKIPTNKAELREFEARYGITCYAYEYHRAKKQGMIEEIFFDIKGETIKREYVSDKYYSADTGLNFADDSFGEEDQHINAEMYRVKSGTLLGMIDSIEQFSNQFAPTHEILNLISEIDEFKGRWTALQNLSPDRLQALRRVATIESVGSSTRIEGVRLSDREVETLLSNLQQYSFKSRDEEEVAGYAAAMELVFESWRELAPTENHIKQLHSVLLQFSGKDSAHRGSYKKLSNNVAAFDADGKEIGIVFETAAPFETPLAMEKLVKWLNQTIENKTVHPLLTLAVFVVSLLAIHPFQDGNGRLSRILTTLLLLRFGYQYVPYASLESIVEDNKDSYYTALRQTQKTLREERTDWEKWCLFFLKCLKKQKDKLAAKLEREKLLAQNVPRLSSEILKLLREHETLTITEIETLTGANRNTLKVRLRELVQFNQIEQNGQARATFYRLKTG